MKEIARDVAGGAIAVIPTDTMYGIVASASQKEAVEKVYILKGRAPSKPCIILIKDAIEMRDFGVSEVDIQKVREFPTKRPTSFIVPISRADLTYLDRGSRTLAFRIPSDTRLKEFLSLSGPIIAPSANTEGNPPATTPNEAYSYFGDKVTHYVDGGILGTEPSNLIDIRTGQQLR